jgi:creatinine amidohydrolase
VKAIVMETDADAKESDHAMTIGTVMLEELTWPLVEKALKDGYKTIIVPVGSIEQHGYHLPLETDSLLGEALAKCLALKMGKTLVAPVIQPGCSVHHMAFPGSLDLSPSTLMSVIRDICFSLDHHGFENIILLPSHGGNFAPVATITQEIAPKLKANLVAMGDLMGLITKMQEGAVEMGIPREAVGGHACAGETSILLAYRPDLVRMNDAKPGYIGVFTNKYQRKGMRAITPTGVLGDPRPSTKEAGELMIEKITEMYLAAIKRELE